MKKLTISWLVSLGLITALSAYPVYMGFITLSAYFRDGYVTVENYPKYVIPYTPLCIALIAAVALTPLLYRLAKRFALAAASLLGVGIFIGAEIFFEQIKVLTGYEKIYLPLQSWQYSLCYATPEVLEAIGDPIYAENNPAFKFHFYIIAIIILLTVTGVVYGFYQMFREGRRDKKKAFIVQLISATVFVGLCVLACFTAFWRNGTLNISPLSAACMILFFVVYGITAGTYTGTFLLGMRRAISCLIPAVTAALITVVMYIGELILTGGKLFSFGSSFFFRAMGIIPFAPVDMLVIIASGALTYLIMYSLNSSKVVSA
jgi:hypothetical protein